MKGREVVVTGMGMVSPLGAGVEANMEGVRRMRSGIAVHGGRPPGFELFGAADGVSMPGDIPLKLRGQMKFLNRGSVLGFAAAVEAFRAAGGDVSDVDPWRRALYVGSGDLTSVGYEFMYPAVKEATAGSFDLHSLDSAALNDAALTGVNPFYLLESISNNLFSFLSAYLEFMGPNTSLASLSPCGGQAMELAAAAVSRGEADVAMAVGCGNWITEVPLFELGGLGLLCRGDEGPVGFRPFDRRRDGFIPGEGGAAVFLESAERAEKRGASVAARLRGWANRTEFVSGDSLGVPDRVGLGVVEAALGRAGLGPGDLAFVCGHGSATRRGDRSELVSLASALDGEAVPLCALKPYTGHMGAASDVAEVIVSIEAARRGFVPATLNFGAADRPFSELRISGSHVKSAGRSFLSLTYGLGGQSSAVVVEVL